MHTSGCTGSCVKLRDNLLVLSFHRVGPGAPTQVVKYGSKLPYSMNHPASPQKRIFFFEAESHDVAQARLQLAFLGFQS